MSKRGASLIELLVVLSIVSTVVVLGWSYYLPVREGVYEAQCRQQLFDVHLAIEKYRQDHSNQDPPHLPALVPRYLNERTLVCPVVRARAPGAVARAEAIRRDTPFRHWESYFYFRRRGLDDLFRRGKIEFGYTHVLNKRKGATPDVVCFDHREPWSLDGMLRADPSLGSDWYRPERPLIVLRRSGDIDKSRYGGTRAGSLDVSTLAYLLNL